MSLTSGGVRGGPRMIGVGGGVVHDMPALSRVRAPELAGRGWLNTSRDLRMADLRGRFVVLDFWTFCCVNCLHVIDELRPLEQKYATELVVVGVHSPKFEHEADPDALAAAVDRHGVHHVVLDDPELTTWSAYTARAWPTLVLIDPNGYVIAQYAGEGHVHAIDALIAERLPAHLADGSLRRGDAPYVPPPIVAGDLRFPASVIALPAGTLLVTDTGHDELVELEADALTVRRRIDASLSAPNGLVLLPERVREHVGYDVVVADTGHHQLVGVRLDDGSARVLAGNGEQWRHGSGVDSLSTPWDVAWWGERVWIAMAGIHQLWTFDPLTGALEVAAGTTNEGLVDGEAHDAWFAQPSGLAPDGEMLWVADAETSAVRRVAPAGAGPGVTTAVGRGLFDFGFTDGPRAEALLQHPLGVHVLPDGTIAVADTYNGAVRRYDPRSGEVTTIAAGLEEPSGLLVHDDVLLVVESAAHRLVGVPLGATATASGLSHSTHRPVTEVSAGVVELRVLFTPPPGQHLDERFGPSTQLVVSSTPPALLREGAGTSAALARTVVLDEAVGDGVLHVAAKAASCDDGVDGGACHLHEQDWGVPVRLRAGAPSTIDLTLTAVEV